MRIDYIRVPGKEWVGDPERRFDSVDIRDPLLRAIRRALTAVMDDLPKSFHLPEGAVERQDIPLLPVNVVREAIVNAVMRRSYRVHGAVQLIRYSNRLEVRNPGYSLKPIDHLGEPGSQVRNTRIANVLYDTRLAETKGTGVGAMRRQMESAGLESPLFASNRGSDQFVATYYFQHFLNEEAIAWLSRFKEMKLNNEEAKALVAVREHTRHAGGLEVQDRVIVRIAQMCRHAGGLEVEHFERLFNDAMWRGVGTKIGPVEGEV